MPRPNFSTSREDYWYSKSLRELYYTLRASTKFKDAQVGPEL